MHYADIKKADIANGTGVRVSVFVSGCTHKCKNCFNSQAWDFNYGNEFTEKEIDYVIKELDKPDAVVYSVEDDKVLMGFESTATGLVGNATWQRTGRIIIGYEIRPIPS